MAYFGYEPSKVAVSVGQGVITSVELGTDAVNTIDILNDAVTPAKIDDDGTGFQMGTLGLGGAVSGAEKLTVTGTASFSGAITGNLTGNASGTSATVTGASQSAITSVGTLTSLTTSGVVLGADGSTSAPSFSFSSDTNTGVYRVSADTLGITASGNRQVRFFDGDTYFDSRIYAHVGSVGNPSYCFNDDTDTGIYKVASNQIGIATNGTRRIKIDASGETAIEGTLITSGSATFAGSLTVHGDAHINDDNTDGRIYISSRGTGDAGHFIRGSDQNLSLNAGGSTGQFRFEINGGAWLSTDNSGNATFSGAVTTNSTFDGVDIATRDGVLTSTTTTANAALPKAGGAMTGAITTNSTFDGRDVATDGTKLDGIASSANNYTHPTSAGNVHIPSGGSAGQILRYASAGTAAWGSDENDAVAMAIALG